MTRKTELKGRRSRRDQIDLSRVSRTGHTSEGTTGSVRLKGGRVHVSVTVTHGIKHLRSRRTPTQVQTKGVLSFVVIEEIALFTRQVILQIKYKKVTIFVMNEYHLFKPVV